MVYRTVTWTKKIVFVWCLTLYSTGHFFKKFSLRTFRNVCNSITIITKGEATFKTLCNASCGFKCLFFLGRYLNLFEKKRYKKEHDSGPCLNMFEAGHPSTSAQIY